MYTLTICRYSAVSKRWEKLGVIGYESYSKLLKYLKIAIENDVLLGCEGLYRYEIRYNEVK